MVLKRGRFGSSWPAPAIGLQDDAAAGSGQARADVPLEEVCPKCGRNLVLRHGRYGEFISCSGYPECKYIKQNFIGVKCPQCADGNW